MFRPFRAGDSAFEKSLKGSDIPAQAEGLGKIPAKRNISPEGAQHKLVCAWLVLDSPRFGVQKQICPAPSGLEIAWHCPSRDFSPGWYVAPIQG